MALDTFNPYLFVSAGEQSNKYLTPAYSGGIASFQAQRAQGLKGLTVQFGAIQEGTGDPSPENIRPISGRTGLTVTRANKNIMPNMAGQSSNTANDITFTYNNDGSVTVNGTASANAYSKGVDGLNYQIYLPHGTYKKPVVQIDASHSVGMFVQYVKSSSNWVAVTGGALASTSFTIDEDYPIVIRVAVQNGATVNNLRFEPYVYPDTVNDLTWVSPVKTNYPITWQTQAGTIYGGTLDVVSGVLTVTHAAVDLGTLNWAYYTSGSYFYATVDGKAAGNHNVIASIYAISAGTTTGQMTDYQIKGHATASTIYVKDSRYTTAAALKTGISGQTAVYELATPQTYQLTPTQVRTIAGYNQIYSDAGPVIDIKF